MKKNQVIGIIIGIVSLILLLILGYFLFANTKEGEEKNMNIEQNDLEEEHLESDLTESNSRRIRFTFEDGTTVYANLGDNATADSLLAQLPTTLTFEDYAGEEKIAYPSETLSQEDAPSGYDPKIGDICVYGPWGNLSVFYEEHGYSNGLLPVGTLEEDGIQVFEQHTSSFQVVVDVVS